MAELAGLQVPTPGRTALLAGSDSPIAAAPTWLIALLADDKQPDPERVAFALLAHT